MKYNKKQDRLCKSSIIIGFTMLFVFFPICTGMPQELTPSQKVEEFLSEALNIENATIVERPGISFDKGLPGKTFCIDDNCDSTVMVTEDGAIILEYRRRFYHSEEKEYVQGKTRADAITETEAFAFATPVLEYLGYSSAREDYSLDIRNFINNCPRNNALEGTRWSIKKYFTVDGVSYRGATLFVRLSAATGTIISISNTPRVLPENSMNIQISFADARPVALNWIRDNYFGSLTGDAESGTIVIAPNVNQFEMLTKRTEALKTYYCWEVPFIWREPMTNKMEESVVWVNIETGEVVGAGI